MYITTSLQHLSIEFRKFMRNFVHNFGEWKKGAGSFFSVVQIRVSNARAETKASGEHYIFRDRMKLT